jgi:hypothetical protein
MTSVVRLLVALGCLALIAWGLATIAADNPSDGMWGVLGGGAGLLALAFERSRYRSEASERGAAAPGPGGGEPAAPGAPFEPTPEVFIDPTSGLRMRVYLDPRSGERRYVAEG